jgi:starch-binding outer membrane protein, SusD/RagB family
MKKTFLYSIIVASAAIFTTTSCKKQLEVQKLSILDESAALKTPNGIDGTITSIYANLKAQAAYGRDQLALPEALADNGFVTNHSGRLVGETRNQPGSHFVNWGNAYNSINLCNLVLDAIAAPASITPTPTSSQLSNWEGQLKFLRALNYFDLARNYSYIPSFIVTASDKGGVPLMLTGIRTSDAASAAKPSRGTIASVYTQMYNDLTTAVAKLPTTSTQYPFRLTQDAAKALFAKVCLYNKDYVNAKTWADQVITSKGATLRTAANYVAGWRSAVNPESLFEVAFATSGESLGVNVSMQSTFTSLVTPGVPGSTGGWGDLGASFGLLTDLGITLTSPATYGISNCAVASRSVDVRNQLFEPGSSGRGLTVIECTKFLGKSGALYTDNIPVIRIAEVYLIRAEAMCADAASSVYNLTNAIADINTIRTNRGLTAYAGAASQAAVLDEAVLQRRLELAMEGNRFYDLKRLGRNILKSPFYSDVLINDYRILPQIPTTDISLNPNIVQNVGY